MRDSTGLRPDISKRCFATACKTAHYSNCYFNWRKGQCQAHLRKRQEKIREKFVFSNDRREPFQFFLSPPLSHPLSFWGKMWYSLLTGVIRTTRKEEKKMKRLFVWMLVLCLTLTACGGSPEETTAATQEATVQYEDIPTEPTDPPYEGTTAPTEPPVAADPHLFNPLTGEELAAPSNNRPYSVMINNSSEALPHLGVAQASMIYETLVEGGITRMMAIFLDPATAGPIGPVRSTREVFVSVMQAYDTIHSSAGGSTTGINNLAAINWDYINGLNSGYFYRDQERLARVALEHTMFIKGENLVKLAGDYGYRTTRMEETNYGLTFDDSVAVEGETANTIMLRFQNGGKSTTCSYDSETGMYTLYQKDRDYIDGTTGEKVPFRNIVILYADTYLKADGIHTYVEAVGGGDGYYARDGKIVPITWSRESDSAPFVYKLADGTDVTFGVGTSYIAIIDDNAPVEFE